MARKHTIPDSDVADSAVAHSAALQHEFPAVYCTAESLAKIARQMMREDVRPMGVTLPAPPWARPAGASIEESE